MSTYRRDGSRVLLTTPVGVPPVVIAVASDRTWAQILVDAMNRSSGDRQHPRAKAHA